MLKTAFDTTALEERIGKAMMDLGAVSLLVRKLIEENLTVAMSQMEYKKKYESLEQNYNEERTTLETMQAEKSDIEGRKTEMTIFIEKFKRSPKVITEWDQILWSLFVSKATVGQDGRILIEFKFLINIKSD